LKSLINFKSQSLQHELLESISHGSDGETLTYPCVLDSGNPCQHDSNIQFLMSSSA